MAYRPPICMSFPQTSPCPVFTSWVSVDGSPTPIFDISTKDRVTTGYIEAREGATFCVHLRDEQASPPHGLLQVLILDGLFSASSVQAATHWSYAVPAGSHERTSEFRGKRISPSTELPFQFGAMQTTDDSKRACYDENIIMKLGTIELALYRVTNVRLVQVKPDTQVFERPLPPVVVHETTKKVTMSHQTRYGPAREAQLQGNLLTHDWIDPHHMPCHSFIFRYLSRDLLELQNLVPRSFPYYQHPRLPQHPPTQQPHPHPEPPVYSPSMILAPLKRPASDFDYYTPGVYAPYLVPTVDVVGGRGGGPQKRFKSGPSSGGGEEWKRQPTIRAYGRNQALWASDAGAAELAPKVEEWRGVPLKGEEGRDEEGGSALQSKARTE